MVIESEMPQTEQGLVLFVHYAQQELKKNKKRNADLSDMIQECCNRLTKAGFYLLNNQWTKEKELCQTQAN